MTTRTINFVHVNQCDLSNDAQDSLAILGATAGVFGTLIPVGIISEHLDDINDDVRSKTIKRPQYFFELLKLTCAAEEIDAEAIFMRLT